MSQKKCALVVSVYNEEDGLPDFYYELLASVKNIPNYTFEIVWVNDGSTDNSQAIINNIADNETTQHIQHSVIEFSKNFGHEAAMMAGIDQSNTDVVICMDSDLQHPPTLIKPLLEKFDDGWQIVIPKRMSNSGKNGLSERVSLSFYKIMNKLSDFYYFEEGVSDFFLISKRVTDILKTEYRFGTRFLRGFVQNIGFEKTTVPYNAAPRLHGQSKYSTRKLFSLGKDAIFSYSSQPLKIARIFSFCYSILSILLLVYSIYNYWFSNRPPSGYTTLVTFLTISFSVLFFIVNILCFYILKILKEIRKEPNYIIKRIHTNKKQES